LYPAAFCSTRNGIPSCFLFRGMVRNGIPRVCFYFWSKERNSKLFSLPRKGLERNFESMLLFLFHGTEFRVVTSSAEGFGTEFREVSVPRNTRNSVGNPPLFRLFRLPRNYFFVGNSQPYLGLTHGQWPYPRLSLSPLNEKLRTEHMHYRSPCPSAWML
jgi:hypothetical protein